ncbi:Gx transporter family protein [Clostridium senegalense]|uniref:Gx transporter family protein n=1 Tax=Clostridium senegalense TaxID=1465809 RepID=UPI0002887183|nr:Gx transporter family protein [Clostridium senegalense]
MKKTSKLVYISLLISQALVLHIVEGMLPIPFITPGARLGLSNIITVIALYTLNYKETFLVLAIRIVLSVMFGGSVSRLMYSLGGAIFSFISMAVIKKLLKNKVSIIGVSVIGAVFHNIGQLIVASLIVETWGVLLYLPILTIAGIGTGIFVGFTSYYALSHLKTINKKMNNGFM